VVERPTAVASSLVEGATSVPPAAVITTGSV
jgi:hypothetical protein